MSKSNTPGIQKLEEIRGKPGGRVVRLKWPKGVRMSTSREFQEVRKYGRTVHSSRLRMSCLISEKESAICIGLVTSRRVGGAVVRSRVRRQLREIFRHLLPQMSPGCRLVITAKSGVGSIGFSDLQEECLLLARKLSILPGLQ